MGLANFQLATRLTFGAGAAAEAGPIFKGLGLRRVLVITDAGVVKAGIAGRVVDSLSAAGLEHAVFDAVEPNPSIATVEKALALFRNASCDGLVAVGGGSPMDVAKAVGVLATNPGGVLDYVGIGKVLRPTPPLVAVPTTVGTGSEVTNFVVITDTAQRKKLVIGSPLAAPGYALLDPELVLGLPNGLVAGTAMDAMTHAVESVISTMASLFADAVALAAIRMIAENLEAALASRDVAPRASLLYASTLAGSAFSYARTGLVHGMAHPLSAFCDVPHGMANAILLPYVMAFNAPACDEALGRVAEALGAQRTPEAAVCAIERLSEAAGIPRHLREVGVTEEFIPLMAQDAFASGNAQVVNPRKPSLDEVLALYRQALG